MKKLLKINFLLSIVFCSSQLVFGQGTSQTVTFNYNGGPQSWTVPTCVTSATVTIAGAQGGGSAGGAGAVITVPLTVTPGQVITFDIGQQGQVPGGGYGGGGIGYLSVPANSSYNSSGGGGASTLTVGGSVIAIAAGGGGTGGGSNNVAGGGGGCATGLAGANTFGFGGGGGTQTSGGAGGTPWASTPPGGSPGALGVGGQGGFWSTASGGGGGGGYYGGGGGGNDGCCTGANGGGGGGGGSSLVPAGAGCNAATNTGNGFVSITFIGGITATASNTGAYCAGDTIFLNGSGGSLYTWTGPNGFSSTDQNPFIPNSDTLMSGTYTLVVGDTACPDTDTTTTIVTVNPMPTVDPVADQILCHGDNTTQVDFSGALTPTTFDWTNDNTNTGLAATGTGTIAPFVGNASNGIPEVSTVIVTPSTAFCVGEPDTFLITVLPTPLVSVSNDTTICENGTGTLVAAGSGGGGGPYIYHWDFTTNTDSLQYVNPTGSSIYSVYVENPYGCTSATETIAVNMHPPLSGTITPYDTICPGYPTNITSTVTGGIGAPYTFVWSTGENYTGNGLHTITANPPVTTDYYVTISDGCETTPITLMTNIRVAPLPEPMVEVLNPIQCEPAIFDIVNTTDSTMSQYNYWVVNDEDIYLNQDTITTNPFYAGEYDVQLVITSYEGCIDSVTFEELLVVDPKPVADFRYSPNPVLMFNTQVHFDNYSFNGYTYEWFFESGYPATSTDYNPDVLFPDGLTGRYEVMLVTTSELGCTDTIIQELIVYPEVLIYAPNTFTPDGDEHNQDWRIYMEGIDVYDFELLIFNRWGEVIWESHDITVPWDGTYNGKPVKQGVYTWVVRTKDMLNDAKYTYDGHINVIR